MEPIATYSEKQFFLMRSYELYEDRITYRVKRGLRMKAEGGFMLKNLQPLSERRVQRALGFLAGILLVLVGWGAAIGLASIGEWSKAPGAIVTMSGLGAIGAWLTIEGLKARENILFFSDAGVPVIAILRKEKNAAEADKFQASLTSQIEKCRAAPK